MNKVVTRQNWIQGIFQESIDFSPDACPIIIMEDFQIIFKTGWLKNGINCKPQLLCEISYRLESKEVEATLWIRMTIKEEK